MSWDDVEIGVETEVKNEVEIPERISQILEAGLKRHAAGEARLVVTLKTAEQTKDFVGLLKAAARQRQPRASVRVFVDGLKVTFSAQPFVARARKR